MLKREFKTGDKVKINPRMWQGISEKSYGLTKEGVYTVNHYYEHDSYASIVLEGSCNHFDSVYFVKVNLED